jgi:hypothetical protein
VIVQLKEIVFPLSVTVTVSVFALIDPVVAAYGVFGLYPYSNSCANATISARRHGQSRLFFTGVPFMNVKGSGSLVILTSDAYVGIAGTLHLLVSAFFASVTVTSIIKITIVKKIDRRRAGKVVFIR